jgi:hypothetical protein
MAGAAVAVAAAVAVVAVEESAEADHSRHIRAAGIAAETAREEPDSLIFGIDSAASQILAGRFRADSAGPDWAACCCIDRPMEH